MSKKVQEIATQIKKLTDELASLAGNTDTSKTSSIIKKKTTLPKGASGALTVLKDEGYFDEPKGLSTIIKRLEQMGYYYKRPTISMNLLNMTKIRELNRFKSKKANNWEYVIRK